MKKMKFRRFFAGACAAMFAATPVMAAQEMVEQNQGASMDVKAEVIEPNQVSYVLEIPDGVDFGKVQQPNSEGTSYVTRDITVKCTQLDGLQPGQVLAVMVKDKDAVEKTDPFKLTNQNEVELTYEILGSDDNNIQDQTWYANGFLFNTFTAAGQSATNNMRLDCGQLYGQDLSLYGGAYGGTLSFYSKVSSVKDV